MTEERSFLSIKKKHQVLAEFSEHIMQSTDKAEVSFEGNDLEMKQLINESFVLRIILKSR
jgi:hypothetical protein